MRPRKHAVRENIGSVMDLDLSTRTDIEAVAQRLADEEVEL